MGRWIAGRGGTLIVSLVLAGTLSCSGWTKHGIAFADQKGEASAPREERGVAASGEAAEYHTPLAGQCRSGQANGHAPAKEASA